MWLWWVGNVIAIAVVVPLVILMANRVIRPAVEIGHAADDILEYGVKVTENLEPVPALIDTASLVGDVTGEAVRYVTALHRVV